MNNNTGDLKRNVKLDYTELFLRFTVLQTFQNMTNQTLRMTCQDIKVTRSRKEYYVLLDAAAEFLMELNKGFFFGDLSISTLLFYCGI